jgi:asparagine synthase (glutamine-hydrolysing)
MCGICGVARRDVAAERGVLEEMAATLVHRGPDSDGFHVDGPVGLAARRLSIIDLEGGDQPIANEDGSVHVVQNGEIYNHEELRAELARAGHAFQTRCDTEVLVHAYEEWGDAFARRLRGMFAVALWDARRSRLVLARDAFGIKPLYYRVDEDGLDSVRFDPPVVERLIDEHVARREDRSRQLWGLLAFTLWHERHVERAPGRPNVPELLAA